MEAIQGKLDRLPSTQTNDHQMAKDLEYARALLKIEQDGKKANAARAEARHRSLDDEIKRLDEDIVNIKANAKLVAERRFEKVQADNGRLEAEVYKQSREHTTLRRIISSHAHDLAEKDAKIAELKKQLRVAGLRISEC